ncbi:hypothetical protein GCM10022286_20030 [Gryllotalpicola daejeonensis]|uniref:Uncharacterized protein n=2 Tax=Gryllotalpicola daejeonensis TaxID=993087 RepID=A0ABP7ZKM9_9MICO
MTTRRLTVTGWIVCGGLLLTGAFFGVGSAIATLIAYFVFGLVALYRRERHRGSWGGFWWAAGAAVGTVAAGAGAFVCFATAFDLADDFQAVPPFVSVGLIGFAALAVAGVVAFSVLVLRGASPSSAPRGAVTAE